MWVYLQVDIYDSTKYFGLFSYKEAFECLKRAQTNSAEDVLHGFEYLDRFNQYILDISDTIWRNKAFQDRSCSICYRIPL